MRLKDILKLYRDQGDEFERIDIVADGKKFGCYVTDGNDRRFTREYYGTRKVDHIEVIDGRLRVTLKEENT